MQPGMTVERGIEFAAKRSIGGLEQHFDVAAREHDGDVAGSGRPGGASRIGIGLNRDRCRRKTATCKRTARGLGVAHEMGDMIEKNLVAGRQLAVDLVARGLAGQVRHSVWAMPAASSTLPQRTISACRNFCRLATEPVPTGIMPISVRRAVTSSIFTIVLSSVLSLLRMDCGVCAEAITPCHAATS